MLDQFRDVEKSCEPIVAIVSQSSPTLNRLGSVEEPCELRSTGAGLHGVVKKIGYQVEGGGVEESCELIFTST
jgi:hypothetical protein